MRKTLALGVIALAVAGCTATSPVGVRIRGSAPSAPSPYRSAPPLYSLGVGVDLYVDRNYLLTQVQSWGSRDIAYLASVLHVNRVGIDWDYVLPSYTSDTVEPSSSITPSPADVAALTSIAQSYGMQVSYRVLFWINGKTEPLYSPHPDAFLASLLAAETPMLQIAQQMHVSVFTVGTERTTLEVSPRWSWFFAQASQIYRGTLSYAMWGGEPGDGGFFWGRGCFMPITVCGVTAYPNTDLPPSASVTKLTMAWEAILERVPASVLRRTVIDETGIPALAGAYRRPWDWPGSGSPDDQVQARWFQAVCAAAGHEYLRAIYFWNAILVDNPADPIPSSVNFEGRPESEAAIRNCQQVADLAAGQS